MSPYDLGTWFGVAIVVYFVGLEISKWVKLYQSKR